jgi:methylmalonyl-CoA mutase
MTTREEWIVKAQAAAKGKPFDAERALHGRVEGHRIWRSDSGPWQIFAQVDHTSVERAEALVREDLVGGVNGLVITRDFLAPVLQELPLHSISIRNDAADAGAEAIQRIADQQSIDPARLRIDFATGDAAFARRSKEAGYAGPFMRADGRPGHANGLDAAQELGAVLAVALRRFRSLEGFDDDALSRAVSVTLVASQDFLGTLAKFRAMRWLWGALLKACHLPDAPLSLHAETSRVMFSDVDAHTNILRATTAAMAAGLGGADSIAVIPFSQQQGIPNSFARRVARNAQHMLMGESHLWRVEDPAAGAGSIETMTTQLCEKAWQVMQRAEAGDWPVGNRDANSAMPRIGVTAYQPTQILAAEIEPVT